MALLERRHISLGLVHLLAVGADEGVLAVLVGDGALEVGLVFI